MCLGILKRTLIQRSPAVLCPTQTGDLLVLDGELVVVGDFLVDVNRLPGVDHDLLLRLHCDDLCITVGLKKDTENVCLMFRNDAVVCDQIIHWSKGLFP